MRVHPDAGQKVEVAPSLGIVEVAALAAGQDERVSVVGLEQVVSLEVGDAVHLVIITDGGTIDLQDKG
jgi:hypothetical protein